MTLEHPPVPGKLPGELPKRPVSRRGFLKIAAGVGAAAGLAAVGGIAIPMISSDGEGANPNPDTQHLSGGNGTPTPDNDPTVTPDTDPTASPTATPEATKTPEVIPPFGELRLAADRAGIEIGTSISTENIATQPRFKDLKTLEFNSASLAYDLSWKNLEKRRGAVDYSNMDKMVDVLLSRKVSPEGHSLIYVDTYPDWLKNGNFSREELIDILKNHVTDTVTHFKGKINRWSIVNEAHAHPAIAPKDVFLDVIGNEYVDIAFQAARDASKDWDTPLILSYDDYGNETPGGPNTPLTKSIVDRLKAKGLIDRIGMQMRIDGAKPLKSENVAAQMRNYGVPVEITEMSVNLKDVVGSQEERFAKQAEIYRSICKAALDSGVCKSITFFTIGDKYSSDETDKRTPSYSPNADPTMYDDDLNPKPAYFAVLDVVKSLPPKAA